MTDSKNNRSPGPSLETPSAAKAPTNGPRKTKKAGSIPAEFSSDLAKVLDYMGDGIIILDGDGQLLIINDAAKNILGITGSIPAGAFLTGCIYDPQLNSIVDSALQKCRERGFYTHEFQSASRTFAIKSITIESSGSTPSLLALILANASGTNELEKKKDEFLALISHELRTPLTIIKGYLDITAQGIFGPLSPELESSVKVMQEQCRNFDLILTDLIRFGMLSKGQSPATPEAIIIYSFLEQYVKRFEARIKSSRISFSLAVPDPRLACFCDEEHLKDLIRHLLDNAIKFAGEGAEVAIRADKFDLKNLPSMDERAIERDPSPHKRWVLVEVADSGPGIPRQKLSEIFNSFEQVENYMTRQATGLGIGLAMVKKIIDTYGGTLWIRSSAHQGTTVSVLLPQIDKTVIE